VCPKGSVIIPLAAVAGARVLEEFSINSNYHISAHLLSSSSAQNVQQSISYCKLAFSTQSHCQHQFNATSPDVHSCKAHYFACLILRGDTLASVCFIQQKGGKTSWGQIEVSVFLVY
jgi:hypothetical protein